MSYTAHTYNETFRDSLQKLNFGWLYAQPYSLELYLKDLLYLDNHLQQIGDHQAPAEGGRVRLVLPVCRTADETFRHSLTKAKFWLAVCSNLKL